MRYEDDGEYVTTRPPRGSQRRYAPGQIPGQQQQARRIIDDMQRNGANLRRRTTAQYSANDETLHDREIAEDIKRAAANRQQKQRKPSWWSRQSPLLHLGVGMCSALFVIAVTVHIATWTINSRESAYYTQSNHRNEITISIAGHQEQLYAFVDSQGNLDALEIVDGDRAKTKLLVGPSLALNFATPQDAQIEIQEIQGQIIVHAVGPMEPGAVWPYRAGEVGWTISANGGK
jgi:hypothetical protein